ncbi:hypothetical protein [Bradyrhizobium lablabi]|uniref:hypothetical protein n=1 Tax=Bradyrhizobium lablabi TaxID=722472 RepID=UPI001BA49800|nr:hypothetical protein [Bradyrhizobium lablabi]MBR0693571.1 hypothetical protein [Bradyrhizobium lablabi]
MDHHRMIHQGALWIKLGVPRAPCLDKQVGAALIRLEQQAGQCGHEIAQHFRRSTTGASIAATQGKDPFSPCGYDNMGALVAQRSNNGTESATHYHICRENDESVEVSAPDGS